MDSIGSGRAIPIKQVSAPFPPGLERSGEEAPAVLEDGSGRWERPAPPAPARPELLTHPWQGWPEHSPGLALPVHPYHHLGAAESHLPPSAALHWWW